MLRKLRRKMLLPYHFAWALLSAIVYRFPARKLTVIGVTGTKGKSSIVEMLFSVLSHAGHKTALAGTIRFAIGEESKPNKFKMTLPGRGFIQKFLRQAVSKGATHAVIEITSEAALQYRHLFLDLNALVFSNLQKEHIESHGSFEKYFAAKFRIGKELARSPKRPRAIVAHKDDPKGGAFLALPVEEHFPFSLEEVTNLSLQDHAVSFTYKNENFTLQLPGTFTVLNALAVIKVSEFLKIPLSTVREGLSLVSSIPGRVERIVEGQDFTVVVDYAHTTDSLRALYEAFPGKKKICVLGNTGGGRDTWKRPEMAHIAEQFCEDVFLTNEDPYDEDPRKIVEEMAAGMNRAPIIVMDRREAIRAALRAAQKDNVVLITGKGTDPYIMGPNGSRTPWSDASVVREELQQLVKSTHS